MLFAIAIASFMFPILCGCMMSYQGFISPGGTNTKDNMYNALTQLVAFSYHGNIASAIR
jgi:hypothetical protein